MDWLNAGALSLMLIMLVGTFHLGAILTGEVGTVARHAANLVEVQPLIGEVELPSYESDSGSSKATLKKGDDSEVQGNETPSENPSEKHCQLLGGTYYGGNCCGPDGMMYFSETQVF